MKGIERIQKMAEGQKDFVLLEVVKYLVSRTDMDDKYLNEEKTLKGMASYMQREILREICEKYNVKDASEIGEEINVGNRRVKCVTAGMSEERTCELAINYFDKSNEELGIKPEEKEKEKEDKNNSEEDDEFGPIFDTEIKENIPEKDEKTEQISLFSYMM